MILFFHSLQRQDETLRAFLLMTCGHSDINDFPRRCLARPQNQA
jgi:hypothetical protein